MAEVGAASAYESLSDEELYRVAARKIARKYDLDPDAFEAQITRESAWNPEAVSEAGAIGLGQLMPDTAKRLGVQNPRDPMQSMDGMAREMRRLTDVYQGDQARALTAYHSGEDNVNAGTLGPRGQAYAPSVVALAEEYRAAAPNPQPTPAIPSGPPPGNIPAEAGRQARAVGDYLRENAGELAGGAIGGLVGSLGGPLGQVAGGTLGGTAGLAAQRYLEGTPASVDELLASGARGLVGEGLGYGLGRLLQPAGTRQAARAAENVLPFERLGVPYTPADVTQGRTARIAEHAATSANQPFALAQRFYEAKLGAFREAEQRLAQSLPGITDVAENVRPELGKFARTAVETIVDNLDDQAARLYAQAAEMGADVRVPTGPLKAAVGDLSAQEALVPASLQSGKALLDDLAALPEFITYDQARELQKRLGPRIAQQSGIQEGAAKRLYRGISESIEQIGEVADAAPVPGAIAGTAAGAAAIDPQGRAVVDTLRQARAITREKMALVTDDGARTALGRIVNTVDDDLAKVPDRLFQRSALGDVRALRGVMGPEDWAVFERYGVERLIEQTAQNPELLPKKLAGLGDDFVNTYFSEPTRNVLRDLATVAERGQMKRAQRVAEQTVGGFGSSARDLLTLGAGGAVGFNIGGPVGGVLGAMSPTALAALITSRPGAYWLSQGLRTPPTAKEAVAIASRLSLIALNGQDPDVPVPRPQPAPRPAQPPPPVQAAIAPPNRKPLPEGL